MKKWLLKIAKAFVLKYDTKSTERFLGYVDIKRYEPHKITCAHEISMYDSYAMENIDHVKQHAAYKIAEQLLTDNALEISTAVLPNGDIQHRYTLWYIKK